MLQRTILHVDMDAFFAAIEQHDRPELKGLPVVVGSPRDRRGVVSTCSYEARKYGIHSAMPSRTAAQRCPQAVFLPVRMARYQEVSRQIMQVFENFTPYVQPLSCDEAFLDVTGAIRLFGDGPTIAKKIKAAILEQTGLTCSIGVAPNPFLAKIASDMNKPDGLTVVPFSEKLIPAFLAPLPIKRMWGAGGKTQAILKSHNIHTIGDLQKTDPQQLAKWIGENAASSFRRRAFGIDERPIETDTEEKSISNEITFPEDTANADQIEQCLLDLADKVGRRLRKAGYYAATAQIKVRWKDFSTITRQRRLDPVCCDDITLRETAMELLKKEGLHSPVRLIGFGVSGLRETADSPQLDLFQSPEKQTSKKREALSRAVDAVRSKFGTNSLRRGSSIESRKLDP
ncbi:DNA polymerase IV [Tichowtungia aerotolerans]|uniref:DNA polymerase IV n=1 Tax=Tichowtungia aerotolerans TaxID=2697043 RepID=A0A6P1M021_9BACT|nr:DNA polymerase IV [Tichowtungia aerotolerans]QHI67900.1 DNA polymerase IV [Tichowtungia aerotolerans]